MSKQTPADHRHPTLNVRMFLLLLRRLGALRLLQALLQKNSGLKQKCPCECYVSVFRHRLKQNQDRQACSTCRCVYVCTHTDTLSSALTAYQQELAASCTFYPLLAAEEIVKSVLYPPCRFLFRWLFVCFRFTFFISPPPTPPHPQVNVLETGCSMYLNDQICDFCPGGWGVIIA